MNLPHEARKAGPWLKTERERRGISTTEMARRISGFLSEVGDPTRVSQQSVSAFEQGKGKKLPPWTRAIVPVFQANDGETKEDKYLHLGLDDASVSITRLPTYAGLGSGGTGDDDEGQLSFSRDLIERELRAEADHLLAMVVEGNSMEPEFFGGDMILVDTRRKSLAQPGAFCLWDGDGHVIKFLERIPESEPTAVRLVSRNELYKPYERLVQDISIIGRVIWYGRRVH